MGKTAEDLRLQSDLERKANWKRWGPYLSERQWGTVREDYSSDGSCWTYFSHDHARSRTYRWGEDGLLGISDRQCRLCFALALWNGKDAILKERLFGLTSPEGNHGEDVKECYYYIESLPTHSYMKGLYKYPQSEFPYAQLVNENRKRNRDQNEYEVTDTGAFEGGRYFDVQVEYAKATPDDILIEVTVHNRSPEPAPISILPTVWYRNTWSWGWVGEGYTERPSMSLADETTIKTDHPTLGTFLLSVDPDPGNITTPLFTENETNMERLFAAKSAQPYRKDAFHEYVVTKKSAAVNPQHTGTKAAFLRQATIPAGDSMVMKLRLSSSKEAPRHKFGKDFDSIVTERRTENEQFYASRMPPNSTPDEQNVLRQAYAGLLWSKQFYYYSVKEWQLGDPTQPAPDPKRKRIRNSEWSNLYNRDIISMPDKWEYPWYAAWDLAFHMVAFARLDPDFAKRQLILFLREWYMHPNGQIPAYEFSFSDVNPPVHAWACWRIYKITAPRGKRDRVFLTRVFQKLLINFTWWVNRKDLDGRNLFTGGFLGLDNIGVFDRSQPIPGGGRLEQADATAWMAFYCGTMLSMALELAAEDHAYGDVASKFFEHFVSITDAINHLGGTGLWDDGDGFYYDQLNTDRATQHLKIRSLVGIMPLMAVEILEDEVISKLSGFRKRLNWFLENRRDLAQNTSYLVHGGEDESGHRLLAVPSRQRLERMLKYVLDEKEFLSPYGIRSLSRVHHDHPYTMRADGQEYRIAYDPGESRTTMFGGNSNWRGPVWFPINYLIIEALEKYHHFYKDSLLVECPTGSGKMMNLKQVANELARRLGALFLIDGSGKRPCHGDDVRYAADPNWKDLVLFHEYFHGDSGLGLGANHQTGWTALAARCLEKAIWERQGS